MIRKILINFSICILLILPSICWSKETLSDALDFESSGRKVNNWSWYPEKTVFFDENVFFKGARSLRIKRDSNSDGSHSVLKLTIPGEVNGKRITLSGYIKTKDVRGVAALWLRFDGPEEMVAFSSTQDQRMRGTSDWKKFTISVENSKEAQSLVVGGLLVGEGKAWFDGLSLHSDEKPISIVFNHDDEDQKSSQRSNIADLLTADRLSKIPIDELATLGKIWGFLKYHHQDISAGKYSWDAELLNILEQLTKTATEPERISLITAWVSSYGLPADCTVCAEIPNQAQLQPNLKWIYNEDLLGAPLAEILKKIYINRPIENKQHYVDVGEQAREVSFPNESEYFFHEIPPAVYRLLALFRLWNAIEYWYPYRNQISHNRDALLREFIPKIIAAEDWDSYRLEFFLFIARIEDSHANLWGELDIRPPVGNCYLPLKFRSLNNKIIVSDILSYKSNSLDREIIGQEVIRIGGKPISKIVEYIKPFYGASNSAVKLRDISNYLPRGACKSVSVLLNSSSGYTEIDIERTRQTNWIAYQRHEREGSSFQKIGNKLAYLKLSDINLSDLRNYLKNLNDLNGIIIDLRAYPKEMVLYELAGHFIQEPKIFAYSTFADLSNPGVFLWDSPGLLHPKTPYYNIKLAILVDETTQSQAEFTALAIRSTGKAIVIGSTTAGTDGNISTIKVPGDLKVTLTGLGIFDNNKQATQKIGIEPDIYITPAIEDIKNGHDPAFEIAKYYLLKE